jgi:NDP-sugar pyrophosphorylase family protein
LIRQLILLAGGKATRLRPVTETIPKSMLEVAGKPFIAHQLELAKSKGIDKIMLCASYLGEMIEQYAGDGSKFGVELEYSFDGDELLGTGGAVMKALEKVQGEFFVMYGDSYLNTDFESINEYFFSQDKPALMTVFRNDGKWDKSNVCYRDGRIITYDKVNRTPDMQYIDYGLGILSEKCFTEFRTRRVFDLAEVYSRLLEKNELAGFEVNERFYEIGSFEGLKETSDYLTKIKQSAN